MGSHKYDRDGNPYRSTRLHGSYDKRKSDMPFKGVDGEGGNVPVEGALFGTEHRYLSLRAGEYLLETGKPLTYTDCFNFLASLSPRYQWVSYFFDYDVTMMLQSMPMGRASRILNPQFYDNNPERGGMWVDVDDFQVGYLPHKEFKVRFKGSKHFTVVSDVGQFFQKPFLQTLEKWNIGTPEERELIRKGKEMRSKFAEMTDETRYYNELECRLLEQLMEQFRTVCKETGYVPWKWQGPGNLASAMLKVHSVPKRETIKILSNPVFRGMAQAAYYGGRFETTAAGYIPGKVYQYDINGAYVHLLRKLPCLIHGSWRRVFDHPNGGIWFAAVRYDHPADTYLCNLPHRLPTGNIRFQRQGKGVYWGVELEAAKRAGTTYSFQVGWVYENHCNCRWFDFVDPYYRERLRLGKSAKGLVLKLAGNSVYGKLAQSIGYAPWANPIWAGLITAGCRAMLIDAYRQAPSECLMLATDGLFMTQAGKLDLPLSKELGEWEETEHTNFFIVQPGIYFSDTDLKTRGIQRGKINKRRKDFEDAWQKFTDSRGKVDGVSVPVTNFITARQAVQRKKWYLAGRWEETTRDIYFSWATKRRDDTAISEARPYGTNFLLWRSLPYDGSPDDESMAYRRLIGGNVRLEDGQQVYDSVALQEAQRMQEQPDWIEPLFSND